MATATRRRKKLSGADLKVLALALEARGKHVTDFESPEEAQAFLDAPPEPTAEELAHEEFEHRLRNDPLVYDAINAAVDRLADPTPAPEPTAPDTAAVSDPPPAPQEAQGGAPALPADVQIPCDKCHGTGKVPYSRDGGKCFRCAHDRQSPAKGYLDHVDLEKNRRRDLRQTNHRWTFMVKAVVDGQERVAPKQFAAAGEVHRVTAAGVQVVRPPEVRVGDRLLIPRLVHKDGEAQPVPVELLAAVVQQAEERKPEIAF
jgi:hypothetical protein